MTRNADTRAALLFLLPSLLGFSLFFLAPFVGGIFYSLVDRPVGGRFVGLMIACHDDHRRRETCRWW
jgi:multiple sugar transport system permease protein